MNFGELVREWKETGSDFVELILRRETAETGRKPEEVLGKLASFLEAMLEEAERCFGAKFETLTGLTGDNAFKLSRHSARMLSPFAHTATVASLSMAESNASMGRVVACPTAGSCGVVPGVLYALKVHFGATIEDLKAPFVVGAAVGNAVASRATLSGAAGGCQAEIGSAAAMASAMLVYYFCRDPERASHAAALSLKALMGLVCDPVGGFVEVPCVKRNGAAVNVAISCAEMALAGIESVIPLDEVMEAMAQVGRALPESLRETARGGVAITPTALSLTKEIEGRRP